MGATITFYLDEMTIRIIDQIAAEEDRSRSNVIRRLVRQEAGRKNISSGNNEWWDMTHVKLDRMEGGKQ